MRLDYKLAATPELTPAPADGGDNQPQRFTGLAYGGGELTFWGERVVFDLDGLQHKAKIGALVDHMTQVKAGVIDEITVGNDINVSGYFMAGEDGARIASEMQQGFPYEMSVYILAKEYDTYTEPVTVNGQEFSASEANPVNVMRKCTLKEVSFVTFGADSSTTAVAATSEDQDDGQAAIITDLTAQLAAMTSKLQTEKAAALVKEFDLQSNQALIAKLSACSCDNLDLVAEAMRAVKPQQAATDTATTVRASLTKPLNMPVAETAPVNPLMKHRSK